MMYGHGKSRPGIVARKPANKAARSATEPSVKEPAAAESVERRAGTKGNADWHSTRRTQRRVSVPQALERIRQVGARLLCRLYPRWEPYAGKLHVRNCAGGARQLASLPRKVANVPRPQRPMLHLLDILEVGPQGFWHRGLWPGWSIAPLRYPRIPDSHLY